jgi:dUTP pyrophosphatase
MELRCKLDYGATLPTRGHEFDAGLDLYSRDDFTIDPGESAVFDTGVHMEIPRGFAGILISKSGLNVNHDTLSTGLIDADYTGSIRVKLYNHGEQPLHIAKKQKISQIMIVPVITPDPVAVGSLSETERGDNGFGSTGAF